MNFEAEKKKIQKMNRSELTKYEENFRKLLTKTEQEVKEAKSKESQVIRYASPYGKPSQETLNLILALSKESRMKKLNSDIQKRKNQLLTPQERIQREAKRKALLKELEVLRAI